MVAQNRRLAPRFIVLVIVLIAFAWLLVHAFANGGTGVSGIALADGTVSVRASTAKDNGITVQGAVQEAKVKTVYVYALRGIVVAGKDNRTVLVAKKSAAVRNGGFTTTFTAGDLSNWRAAAAKLANGLPYAANNVLQFAVSGYSFQNTLNPDTITASTFIGYSN